MSGQPLAVAVAGAAGRMGTTTVAAVKAAPDLKLVAGVDPRLGNPTLADALEAADVLVDFTAPGAVLENVRQALRAGVHVVVGTTGFSLAELTEAARGGSANVFVAPNFAIGAVLLMRFAKEAAAHLERAEIIELHHQTKVDAPSGTALRTAQLMKEAGQREVPIHSVRLPGLVAHQEVILGDLGQTLTLRHDTTSREAFMPGVLLAIRAVPNLSHSPLVGLEHLLFPEQP